MSRVRRRIEHFVENVVIQGAGASTIFILILILLFLIINASGFYAEYPLGRFLFGEEWAPNSEKFGSLPLIYGSVMVTLVAVLFAVPLSLGTALFISEIAGERLRNILKVFLEILASVPSVVFGFLGIIVVGPGIAEALTLKSGSNAFTAGLLLAFMSIPTIASVAEEALQAVPRDLREASLGLGATRLQTMLRITFPAASGGIIAAVMLGVGRAIGETMTVMMVAGGSPNITGNVFDAVRTMTGTIATEMGETGPGQTHYHALFAIGVNLFLITLLINSVSGYIIKRIRDRHSS